MAKAKGKQSAPTGRPSKYKPEYCQGIIDHMSKGLSFETYGAVVGVDRDTLYEWGKVHPAFSDAIKAAKEKGQLFWETVGMTGMSGRIKGFNAAVWIFNMKNRFKWRDSHNADEAPALKEQEKTIEEALAALDAEKPRKPTV